MPSGGVVESLLRRVRSDGWHIGGGCPWRRIRKFKIGRDLHDFEMRNVLGVVDQAAEVGCDAIAFVRDRDGEVDRQHAIEAALGRAGELDLIPNIIGGIAIETTDAWILALLGHANSEQIRNPKQTLRDGHEIADGRRKSQVVAVSDLTAVPHDAHSLRRWIERAAEILGTSNTPAC